MFDSKLYKETFSRVRVSEEMLSEVLNMTKQKKNTGIRVTRMLVIAAVITAMLATTVFAYVGFTRYDNPMQMLRTFFGDGNQESSAGQIVHETYYELEYDLVQPTIERVPLDEKTAEADVVPYVSAVGESVSYGEYTLTIEAHLYDSATDCGVIYYTIENPNGMSGYELQYDGEVWFPGGELILLQGAAEKSYIIEAETTATKLAAASYYCGADAEDFLMVGFYGDEDNSLRLSLQDGGGMDAITFFDGDIAVSPVAMRITLEDMDFLLEREDGSYSPDKENHINYLAIRNKDGSEYVLMCDDPRVDNIMYALITYDGNVASYDFNRLIDLEQVEAVIINDVEFTDLQQMTREQRNAELETNPVYPVATEPANP